MQTQTEDDCSEMSQMHIRHHLSMGLNDGTLEI